MGSAKNTAIHRAKIALGVLAFLLAASTSTALELSVIGPNEITVAPGEQFTLDVALTNDLLTPAGGIEVMLHGLTAADATPLAGRTALYQLVDLCIPSACSGGTVALSNDFVDPNDLLVNYTVGSGAIDPDSMLLILAIAVDPSDPIVVSSGMLDPGLDGALDEPSARDVTLDLVAQAIGTHVLSIEGRYIAEGFPSPPPDFQQNATFTIHVVPEPSTALLLLGGLAALARSRRDSREVGAERGSQPRPRR